MILVQLENRIKELSQKYYEGVPIATDSEFDSLVDELKATDPENKLLRTVGWGYIPSTKAKSEHVVLMGSLKKIKYEDGTFDCADKIISHKLDGASATAYYENGKLDKVVSRGDGLIGVDITKMMVLSGSIPMELNEEVKSVRGEVVISDRAFKEMGGAYSSHRNCSTGISQSMSFGLAKHIEFIAYHIIETDLTLDYYGSILRYLFNAGFAVVNYNALSGPAGYRAVHDNYDTSKSTLVEAKRGSHELYLVDGAVVCNDEIKRDGDIMTYDAFAVKYANTEMEVTVSYVEWNKSLKGRLIPVICFEPVFLSGAMIQRCTAHNALAIHNGKIGAGSVITIKRSNEVIPYWADTVTSTQADMPSEYDGVNVVWEGVHLREEMDVERKMVHDLLHRCCPDGIGGSTIDAVIERYNITCLTGLGEMSEDIPFNSIREIWGYAYSDKIIKMLENIRTMPLNLYDLMMVSGVDHLGNRSADAIASSITRDELIIELRENHKFPEKVEKAIPTYVPSEDIKTKWEPVLRLLNFPFNYAEYAAASEPDNVIKVTLTGKMSSTRNDLLSKWKKYEVVETSVNNCDYLVYAGNKNSSKYKKAYNLSKQIVTEEEFEAILRGE